MTQSSLLPTNERSPPSTPKQANHVGTGHDDARLSTQEAPALITRLIDHIQSDISANHADIPIILCCLVSGLCDSSAYNAWTCFVSMQTGNTIFLALGASGQPASRPYGWLKSLVSILSFLLGCLVFSLFSRRRSSGHGPRGSRRDGAAAAPSARSPRSRLTLVASFGAQSLLIFAAAALVQSGAVPASSASSSPDFITLLPLACLALQSGGQIVGSRVLGFGEVPTTVLTSVYCDLAMDPHFFAGRNLKRNRRLAAVVCFLVGGVAGGWLAKSSGGGRAGLAAAFWVAGGVKLAVALAWLLWARQVDE